jgi:hypothetical protein
VDGLTLDTGALIALEKYRKGMTAVVEAARVAKLSIVTPAACVAEWWRARTDRREYVRKLFSIRPLDERIATTAGEALAWFHRTYGGAHKDDRVTIDATVITTAALWGPILYTGDQEDMERFGPFFPNVRIFSLR